MIAGLPMYDRPETFEANDRLWDRTREALADRGIAAPERLDRDIDIWSLWRHPDLVLAQTCGLPYRARLQDAVQLVATPIHDLPCEPGFYFSAIVVRMDDQRSTPAAFEGSCLAVNDRISQSGWAAPMDWAAGNAIGFGKTLFTGSHLASSRAVAEGRADLTALDAVTWRMIRRWDAHAATLRVLAHTRPTPALPYISAADTDSDLIYQGLRDAVAVLNSDDQLNLGINGVIRFSPEHYLTEKAPQVGSWTAPQSANGNQPLQFPMNLPLIGRNQRHSEQVSDRSNFARYRNP